ncbi:MAG: bifunctional glutamate N-acetyltransferase/amino-acid acetyltransferase ArgJ [Deltaproteobacteria bacterium]|nr:bifunctional glutamate N-acetyltransferase/amino-acid acetyltransferase ArgJ [Deltaproteobacteria bacterium]
MRVRGFRAGGVHCGIKDDGLDLALLVSDVPAAVAGVFTRSTVVGAPVELCRERVRRGRARAVVVNSGISNVAMGARGKRDAEAMTVLAARAIGADPQEVLVASTGVIGEPLPMPEIRRGIPLAAEAASPRGWGRAARAIMTTDTFPKSAVATARLGGREITVAGIAKGSGMIEPDMATMLAFLATDAAVQPALLRRVLREVADASFNRVSVDGETSTSDTLLLFANGEAGNPILRGPRSPGVRRFAAAVTEVASALAQDLARDGEGATKLVTVRVSGARSQREAERAARRIANSMLVKTALFGGDANWGRILQTVGAGRVALCLERSEVALGGVTVFRRGASTGPAARRRAAAKLRAPELELEVKLGVGRGQARIWTCDLSYDYVRINAEYTT